MGAMMVKKGNEKGPRKSQNPTCVFDQENQSAREQTNVAIINPVIHTIIPAKGASFEALRQSYRNRIFKQTCDLELYGIDPKAAITDTCQKMQLSAVYTGLLTRQPDTDPEELAESVRPLRAGHSKALSALALLNREKYLVLLGDPGSGKSTFVNFVALCLAGEGMKNSLANINVMTAPLPFKEDEARGDKQKKEGRQPWDHGPLLPVRIVLRDLAARGLPEPGATANRDTLWKFIESELGNNLKEFACHLYKQLQEEGGLILLDGLDEVPDARDRRLQVKEVVKGFVEDFPECRVLATSRTYAYQKQEWKLDSFAEALLSPFTPGQISYFVNKWYKHVGHVRSLNSEEAIGRARLLNTAIKRSERLAELAERPLLLTLMASLHAWRGGSLPEKREELYADAVDLLLDQWESPKVVRDATGQPIIEQSSIAEWLKVDKSVVRSELNLLAFEAHRDQEKLAGTADISQERLVTGLIRISRNKGGNPLEIEGYIRDRTGLLSARGDGVYAFPHRTFQEYLAACHLTDLDFPDAAADLLRADPQRWREAVLLAGSKAASGASSAAWNLADALCFREVPETTKGGNLVVDCWGALLAGQTLLENEKDKLGQVSERNAPKLERIRRWLSLIVVEGLLPPVDRALAGECLSLFGDDRDFEELVPVPKGEFPMGNDRDKISLPGFKIGRYPVTNAQYLDFINATDREWLSPEGFRTEYANCPAATLTWHDARAFCEWLTVEWQKTARISRHEVVRLPTEAEWEKAARGTDARVFPWGDSWEEDRCNSSEAKIGKPCAVGMFPGGATPCGCLDMAGNVWEWTSTLWGKSWSEPDFRYPYQPDDGRENLDAGYKFLRVLRGGSCFDARYGARCVDRFGDDPYFGGGFIGFRVAFVFRLFEK
jgi:formylglycine-generating enzyme required for sulfatase activity